jgi:hypothetical protein
MSHSESLRQRLDDPRARSLAEAYGKRDLAAWVLSLGHERRILRNALEEIARWDDHKTLGYEGPKRIAVKALEQAAPTKAPMSGAPR